MSGRDERQQTSQEIKQGPIEIDYDAVALVVNYTIEKVITDHRGRVLEVVGRSNKVQRVKLHMLTPEKNMAKLADEVIRNCNRIIHPSRTEELEQLLLKLQKHVVTQGKEAKGSQDEPSSRAEGKPRSKHREKDRSRDRDRDSKADAKSGRAAEGEPDYIVAPPPPMQLPPAHMGDLDEYLELLYQVPNSGTSNAKAEEGMREQIKGTAMLLALCREDVMNLEQLIQNSTVMGALTRVFQEEFKKSIELTFNILRIFLSFSNFVEMHDLMSSYRIGLLSMKSIEFEIARAEHRDAELAEKISRISAELKVARNNKEGLPDDEVSQKIAKLRRQRDKEEYFHGLMSKKQDKVLFVALYILLNLAEEPAVEKKMVKKELVPHLVFMLSRKNADLLVISVTFLRKLSIIEENKDSMRELQVIPKLIRFIPCSSQALVNNILRLLFNLSYDKECRNQMVRAGLLPKLIKLLSTQACFRGRSLKLLYHLSADDTCKSMFSFSGTNQAVFSSGGFNMGRSEMVARQDEVGGITLILGMIVNFPQDQLPKELAALAVNLTYNKANCSLMIQSKAVSKLIERYLNLRQKDSLLMKIIRNLSLFTFNIQQEHADNPHVDYQYRGLWSPHIKSLVMMLAECDNHDILVEILGTLANLTVADLPSSQPWAKFIKEFNLVSLLSKLLIPGMSQNDVILEVVMFTSAMLSDPDACAQIVATNLIQLLLSMWKEKGKHDVEILLQLIYCIYKLLIQKASREEVLYGNRVVVTYLLEALEHSSGAVRRIADEVLGLVVDLDRKAPTEAGSLSSLIRKKRFESYNAEWFNTMSSMDMDDSHGMYGDDYEIPGVRGRQQDYYMNNYGDATSYEHQQSPLIEENPLGRPRTFSGDEDCAGSYAPAHHHSMDGHDDGSYTADYDHLGYK